jgi:hypothetical protein
MDYVNVMIRGHCVSQENGPNNPTVRRLTLHSNLESVKAKFGRLLGDSPRNICEYSESSH